MSLKLSALGLAAAALTLAACQSPQQPVPPNTLVALKVAAAPNMNAGAADPVWAKAQPVAMTLTDGVNFAGGKGETQGQIKAVYTADTMYMLVNTPTPRIPSAAAPTRSRPTAPGNS